MTEASKAAKRMAEQLALEAATKVGAADVYMPHVRGAFADYIQHVSDVASQAMYRFDNGAEYNAAKDMIRLLILPDDEPTTLELVTADLCPRQGAKGNAAVRLRESLARHGLAIVKAGD